MNITLSVSLKNFSHSFAATECLTANLALLAAALVLSVHFTLVDNLRAPLVWNLPYSELSVFAGSEEHILQFVVVNQAHLFCERSLEHKDALATLLDVSNSEVALLRAFNIARHSRKPLESSQGVLPIAFV